MKSRRRSRTPPSSSHAHRETPAPLINVDDLSTRLGHQEIPRPSQSYISLLPPEILSEVFRYCIPQGRFPNISTTLAPILLTHVSPYWRTLALALPELWSSLHISYIEDIASVESFLCRSGDRPLSLSISIDFGEESKQEFLTVVQKHSKRWKHVRFDFRHLLCPPVYTLDQALDNVPELETFEFQAKDISDVNVAPVIQLLRSAPKLRELSWVDDLADMDTLLQLPLSRLTNLSLSIEQGTLDYLQVLKECSNLEHIRLMRPRPREPAPQPQTPLFLPKLTSLNISSDMVGILHNLVLPALQEVRIYGDQKPGLPRAAGHTATYMQPGHAHSPSAFDATALVALIDRSLCAITSLAVKVPMTEDTLMVCLQRMSGSLVRLSVDGAQMGDALLRMLTWKDRTSRTEPVELSNLKGEGGVVCPKLEEINFDSRVLSSHGMLASMIESRVMRAYGIQDLDVVLAPLRALRVVDGHKDLERLRALSVLSRRQHPAVLPADEKPALRRSWTEGEFRKAAGLQTREPLVLTVTPAKMSTSRMYNGFSFRRKPCASR